ncbi:pentapeptide repeat-containing protein [Tolypothrix campylonemoides VB511288]|nr:pentapeptide repeat-containing protein [Tolypothrix campylonemoides VB511288]
MEALELLQRYVTGERDFTRVELAEVNLCSANLIDIDLSGAILSGAKRAWS